MEVAPQVVRIWTGTTRLEDADEYEKYLVDTGLAGYSGTPGNLAAYFTRRNSAELTEFFVISVWESMDAVRSYAGDDPEVSVYYPEDDRFLIDRDLTVRHYQLFASSPLRSPGSAGT